MSLGLEQAGFQLLGGVDRDQQVLDTHKANFPGVPTLRCDLFSATGADVRNGLNLEDTSIDLLAGGPPCQGFSSGGKRGEVAKLDPRNQGIMSFARLVGDLRPRYFLMENVRGFLFQDHEALRGQFTSYLEEAGYRVLGFRLLNAADYGVPQRRERAFVLGCLDGEDVPNYPSKRRGRKPTVRSAIADLAVLDARSKDPDIDVYKGRLGTASAYARRLRVARNGGRVLALTGCLRTVHSAEVERRFRATSPGGQEPVSRFFRLAWGGVSPTIRAGTGPEHGSHTAPRPIHPRRARCITVREAARLHTFPDWFVFRGTRWHGFRQIGNSVPPMLAKAVAAEVARVCGRSPDPNRRAMKAEGFEWPPRRWMHGRPSGSSSGC